MPPVTGDSAVSNVPGVLGQNTANGDGVFGHGGPNGRGVVGVSDNHTGTEGNSSTGTGVWGSSKAGEGVHGESNSDLLAAVAGIQINPRSTGAGVYGEHRGSGPGGFFKSRTGEGVHGETRSGRFAAVAGISLNPERDPDGMSAGVWGSSQSGEGVHGESNSDLFAAVAGIQINPRSTGAGIYGEHRGTGPAGFFRGNVVVTGDIFLTNADCAEDFDVSGDEKIEPGTVMVINQEGALQQSHKAYDKRVAGVISGAGDCKPAIILDKQQSQNNRMPIALVGKVYAKVDAQYSPIEVGDLLTTSPTPGHAMKAEDPLKAFGAVIGKALRPLEKDQGLIPILIALQ